MVWWKQPEYNICIIYNENSTSESKKQVFHVWFLQLLMISGPDLPVALSGHSMVTLYLGQAIIGGENNGNIQKKIYLLECSDYSQE